MPSAHLKVMHYFRTTPQDQKPLGPSLGCADAATALSLLTFTGKHWLDDKTISCGLDVIRRRHPASWPRTIIGTALFGTACNPRNAQMDPSILDYCVRALRNELNQAGNDLKKIYFPFWEGDHQL